MYHMPGREGEYSQGRNQLANFGGSWKEIQAFLKDFFYRPVNLRYLYQDKKYLKRRLNSIR